MAPRPRRIKTPLPLFRNAFNRSASLFSRAKIFREKKRKQQPAHETSLRANVTHQKKKTAHKAGYVSWQSMGVWYGNDTGDGIWVTTAVCGVCRGRSAAQLSARGEKGDWRSGLGGPALVDSCAGYLSSGLAGGTGCCAPPP